jgi:hypothetical protein
VEESWAKLEFPAASSFWGDLGNRIDLTIPQIVRERWPTFKQSYKSCQRSSLNSNKVSPLRRTPTTLTDTLIELQDAVTSRQKLDAQKQENLGVQTVGLATHKCLGGTLTEPNPGVCQAEGWRDHLQAHRSRAAQAGSGGCREYREWTVRVHRQGNVGPTHPWIKNRLTRSLFGKDPDWKHVSRRRRARWRRRRARSFSYKAAPRLLEPRPSRHDAVSMKSSIATRGGQGHVAGSCPQLFAVPSVV